MAAAAQARREDARHPWSADLGGSTEHGRQGTQASRHVATTGGCGLQVDGSNIKQSEALLGGPELAYGLALEVAYLVYHIKIAPSKRSNSTR